MLVVETIAKIRRAYFVQKKAIKEICRDLNVSRKVVRKVLRSGATEFVYERKVQPQPKLGPWREELERLLAVNAGRASRERLTLVRVFEELRGLGYEGGYDAVRRYAAGWQREHTAATAAAFVPLSFAPGEAYQFDWSHEIVLIAGTTVTVKVAQVRLCHSRMLFVRAYPRESQEMVLDAHDRAFAFFKGACTRGIYDNMKTAVDAILFGKTGSTTGASSRCAGTTWSSRWHARRRPAGRRARSRGKSARCGSASSRRGYGCGATMS
jgi:transposase